MSSILQEFIDRELLAQSTNLEAIEKMLENEKVSFYIGFDPTADSLHVGHFMQMKIMAHMQRAGHRPIAVFGGGTGMIGDPSGKSDMRKMLTKETIAHNIECFKKQMGRFIDTSDGKAIFVNNADWLYDLNYIDFLREVGPHFSVNRMLSAECYKQRMETGLTFLEFNYMIMQSYDFYRLYNDYGCKLEFGGDDQWSNIIGGVELIRRKMGGEAYGMTFKLLTNSEGKKMGKTEKGAVWLDPEKTSPYEFFQYWRNIDDADVRNCLSLLTFIPMDEVRAMTDMEQGADINKAKERLAHEVTSLVHGKDEADKALAAAKALFGGGGNMENVPTTEIPEAELGEGMDIITLLAKTGVVSTNSEARRLIKDGGIYFNNERVTGIDLMVTKEAFAADGYAMVRKGKKVYHKVVLV